MFSDLRSNAKAHPFPKSLERLGHADYFGERALLGNEVRSASITALEERDCNSAGSPHVGKDDVSGHGALENGQRNLPGNDAGSQSLLCPGRPSAHDCRQGQCLDYLKDRISLQDIAVLCRHHLFNEALEDTALTFKDLEPSP